MTDPLPVPAQLDAQLGKCRSVRNDTFRKGRDKTPQVRGLLRSNSSAQVLGSHVTRGSSAAAVAWFTCVVVLWSSVDWNGLGLEVGGNGKSVAWRMVAALSVILQ